MTTRARWLPKAKFTATTVAKQGAWKEISKSLYSLNLPTPTTAVTYDRTIAFTRSAAATIEDRVSYSNTPTYTRVLTGAVGNADIAAAYSRTIAFTRSATAGIEDRVSYSNTISFSRSSILGVTIAPRYERAISFSRTYTANVATRAFYSNALSFGARVFELVITAILYWTTPKLSKKKASNYKNFFRGRR